jgi:hypothetical protein
MCSIFLCVSKVLPTKFFFYCVLCFYCGSKNTIPKSFFYVFYVSIVFKNGWKIGRVEDWVKFSIVFYVSIVVQKIRIPKSFFYVFYVSMCLKSAVYQNGFLYSASFPLITTNLKPTKGEACTVSNSFCNFI